VHNGATISNLPPDAMVEVPGYVDRNGMSIPRVGDLPAGAVCDPPEVWQMANEMLVAEAKWLPQYKAEIAAAKKRLAGKKLATKEGYKGAARLHVKTVAEMAADKKAARANAGAADKAKQPKAVK
jgi:alpha-galactosidase